MAGRVLAVLALSSTTAFADVPASTVFPMVEYWFAQDYRPNPLCAVGPGMPVIREPGYKATSYPFRKDVGLKDFSATLLGVYGETDMAQLSTQDLRYMSKLKKRTTDHNIILKTSASGVVAAQRSSGIRDGSVQQQVCGYFEEPALSPKTFCSLVGNFSQIANCLDNYEYEDVDAVIQQLAPESDFGFTLAKECYGPLTAGRATLGFELQSYLTTPDVISESAARAEWRYYFLAWKALDHFNRYVEYKYLTEVKTRKTEGDKPTIQTIEQISQDSEIFEEILPEWKVTHVYRSAEPKFMGGSTFSMPLAVMAARGRGLLIVFREPTDTYDGRLNMHYNHQFTHLFNFTGSVHSGGAAVYQALSSIIERHVVDHYQSLIANPPEDDTVDVSVPIITIVAAHQPMVSTAVILATELDKRVGTVFNNAFGVSTGFRVQTITFGSPYVGSSAFNGLVRKRVATRHMTMHSLKDFVPCSTSYSCDERDLLARTGFLTGAKFEYAELPGKVELDPLVLEKHNEVWTPESISLQVASLDRCGVPCILAGEACPTDDAMKYCSPRGCENFV